MVCSCEFFRCRPRSNRIWAPFSVRKVHPDFHGGYTSLQIYRPDTNLIITVSASHTGINCDPSATASQVGVNCTMSVLCLFFYFSRLDALEFTIYTSLAADSQGSPPTYTSRVLWWLVWGMYNCYVSDTVGHVLSQSTVFSGRQCQASEMAQQVKTPDAKPDDQRLILSTHSVWENQFQQVVLQQINKLNKILDFHNICNMMFLSLYYISFISTSHEVFLLKICQQIVDDKDRTKF